MDDFSKIVLDKREWEDLRLAYRGKLLFRPRFHGDALIDLGLLRAKMEKGDTNIMRVFISDAGKRYVLYANRKRREKWVPIWISVAALVISAIALLGQLKILPMP